MMYYKVLHGVRMYFSGKGPPKAVPIDVVRPVEVISRGILI